MCVMKAPKAPAYVPPPEVANPEEVTKQKIQKDQVAEDTRDNERKKHLAKRGMRAVMATGAQGVTTAAPVSTKTLLGQ